MVVFIIDNSKMIVDRLIELISETQKDITFYQAVTNEESVALLVNYKPDAVIIDCKFCDADTRSLLEKVKKANKDTVTIVLSHFMDEHTVEICRRLDVDFLFDKYNDFTKIPAIIQQLTAANKKVLVTI